ncbi:MAG: hypothetical protein QOF44_2047 [Streptomyces sp.]|nr:hypothetical protein [Streptomyces sp.]
MCVLRKIWVQRPVRWTIALVAGAFWWWAVLRLAVVPARTGPVEGLVAAGGWGLSLIPLHSVTRTGSRRSGSSAPATPAASCGARLPGPRRPLTCLPGHGDAAVGAQDLAGHKG